MQSNKIFRVVGIVAAIIIIGLGVGWWASRNKTDMSGTPMVEEPFVPTKPAAPKKPFFAQPGETNEVSAAPEENNDWEDKISDILGADKEVVAKANELLNLYPTLSEAGKVEAAGHLANLVEDDNFDRLKKILLNPKIPPAAAEVLFNDSVNRPNDIRMPIMLAIACDPNHPQHAEAKDMLERILEEEFGGDCAKMKQAVIEWMKQQGEEPPKFESQ